MLKTSCLNRLAAVFISIFLHPCHFEREDLSKGVFPLDHINAK